TLIIYILLAVSSAVTSIWGKAENLFATSIVLQILIFTLPMLFYTKARGISFSRKMRLKVFSPGKIVLIIGLLGVMIFGTMLINIFFYGLTNSIGNYNSNSAYSLTEVISGQNVVYSLITFCFIPAICEEFVFRGVIMSEYAGYGPVAGILISSILFGMAHFDFVELPAYIFSGVVLAGSVYMTKSLYAALIIHICNNIFSIFAAPYIWAICLQPSGILFTVLIFIVFFFICLIMVFKEGDIVYYEYAYDYEYSGSEYRNGWPEKRDGNFALAFFSPTLILTVVVYIIITIYLT
ncbi:MAG: CPBP family intramembrane metalloprotease, partial [Clostridia bacterium]|nr:CPBP family intramembrane metalloprotease [Clostridia bacterium]